MLKYWLLLIFLFSAGFAARATDDPQKAFSEAAASGKPVLLVFQGSDWCIPCIRLDQRILSAPAFVQFAADQVVLLKADFPQKKKIAPQLEKQYEQLAEQYNREGSFPKLILLDKQGRLVHLFRTDYAVPEELISELKAAIKALYAQS